MLDDHPKYDNKETKINDLQKRLFEFAVKVIKLVRQLPKGKEYDVISYQLILLQQVPIMMNRKVLYQNLISQIKLGYL
jgi:hypothetical protein